MPTLDDLAKTLWNTTKPQLGLLGAIGCARAADAMLAPEDRAPFEALTAALLDWPKTQRSPTEIHAKELADCKAAFAAPNAGRLRVAMDAAWLEMAALTALRPRSMPPDQFDALGEDDFVKLTRRLAKEGRTDLELWKTRYEHLLAAEDKTWPPLAARVERIGWERPMARARELTKPLQDIARMSDLGATSSWTMMGPKHALTLQLGTTKRTAILDDEARGKLVDALPWLA